MLLKFHILCPFLASYDDIDRTDCAALLRKQNIVGEKKKHKIGDITIPSCSKGFQLINDELLRIDGKSGKPTFNQESEIMAKIIIDISMNKLIDASTLVKIGQLISKDTKKNIVIVCYMGSVHTRAICDFFTQPHYGFKKKIFCGKYPSKIGVSKKDESYTFHLSFGTSGPYSVIPNLKFLFCLFYEILSYNVCIHAGIELWLCKCLSHDSKHIITRSLLIELRRDFSEHS